MTNTDKNQMHPFIKNEWLKTKRISFFVNILFIVFGYIGVTIWLNAIRATAQIWFVWVLIIVQFILYFAIFSTSYMRFKDCGHKRFGIVPFIILAILGRVNNWELLIIPLLVISMLIISAKSKHLSEQETI